jgi:ribosomal protein L40E
MSEKTAAADQAVKFSKKCSECGLNNFVDAKVCRRCESDLSRRSTGPKKVTPVPAGTGEVHHFKAGRVLIFAAALVVSSVLLLSYVRQAPPGSGTGSETGSVPGEADIAKSAKPSEQPAQNATAEDAQSEAPAKQVLAGLRHFQEHFQDTPKSSMTYEEYDQMLTHLKADLNDTLPTFVRHSPSDERFRTEVAAALRDYTAAGDWWKTTIRNSKVLNDADRTTRLQAEWGSAQTHLDNAEKLLLP